MQRGLGDIAADCPRLCRSIIDVGVEAIVRSSSRIFAVALSAIWEWDRLRVRSVHLTVVDLAAD